MSSKNKKLIRIEEERGNALFLILIAVALFAALSYAITQSGRGSGTVNKETAIVVSGQVVEEPAAIRTAVTRMIITGTSGTSITFNTGSGSTEVFDVNGGGATNVAPPSGACGTAADCASWLYQPAVATGTNGFFIQGVGTTTGSEALAILGSAGGGMSSTICTQIQKGLGFTTTTPVTQATAVAWTAAATVAVENTAAGGDAGTVAGAAHELSGQAFACFQNGTGGKYSYYHALIEQ